LLSALVRRPNLSAVIVLQGYIAFYRTILPYKRGFVLASFNKAIKNFGEVIKRDNEKFNNSFVIFDPNEENIQKAFRLVKEMDKREKKRCSYGDNRRKTFSC